MNKLFLFLYCISTFATIGLFYFINLLTEPFNPESILQGGGNGNPGLFPIIFLFPFLLYFIYGTTKIVYQFLLKNNIKLLYTITIGSFIGVVSILYLTLAEAYDFKKYISNSHPSYALDSQIPLLNTYSNNLFFNTNTFIMLVLICTFIAGIFSIKRIRKCGNM